MCLGMEEKRMRLDTNERQTRDPQSSPRLRSRPWLTSGVHQPTPRRHPQLRSGLGRREHLAGRKGLSWGPTGGGRTLVSPQGWAHSQLCLATCLAIPTPLLPSNVHMASQETAKNELI